MKKLLYMLLLASFASFAQEVKVPFQAQVENRNSDTLYIRSRTAQTIITADKQGNFKENLNINPGLYQLYDGKEYAMLYIDAGYDLSMKLDAQQFDESIAFTGKGAAENNWLAKKMLADQTFRDKMDDLPDDVNEVNKMIGDRVRDLRSGLENPEMSAGFKEMMINVLKQEQQQLQAMADRYREQQKMQGKPSPLFAGYENHKGGTTSLADFKGKYVYIDVWATWCGPCRKEIPYLKQVEAQYHDKNIVFVSISVDKEKDHDKWKTMVKDEQLGGVQLIADKDWKSDFVVAYGIRSIPRFILIDPQGKIVRSDAPRPSDPKLKKLLDKLLK
jgi:thiol-disulfide isomerase/thioredoxin